MRISGEAFDFTVTPQMIIGDIMEDVGWPLPMYDDIQEDDNKEDDYHKDGQQSDNEGEEQDEGDAAIDQHYYQRLEAFLTQPPPSALSTNTANQKHTNKSKAIALPPTLASSPSIAPVEGREEKRNRNCAPVNGNNNQTEHNHINVDLLQEAFRCVNTLEQRMLQQKEGGPEEEENDKERGADEGQRRFHQIRQQASAKGSHASYPTSRGSSRSSNSNGGGSRGHGMGSNIKYGCKNLADLDNRRIGKDQGRGKMKTRIPEQTPNQMFFEPTNGALPSSSSPYIDPYAALRQRSNNKEVDLSHHDRRKEPGGVTAASTILYRSSLVPSSASSSASSSLASKANGERGSNQQQLASYRGGSGVVKAKAAASSAPDQKMDSKQIILQWNECIDQLRSTCDDLQEHEAIELLQTSVSEGVDPSVRIMKFRSKDGHKTFETITHTTAEGLFCPIELEVQTAASGIVLRCGHAYNRKALEEYARTAALEEGNLPLRCPNHATGDKCPFLFSFEETLNILLDGEEAVGNIEKRMEIEDRLTTNFTARVASRMGIRRCVKCLVYIKVPANSKYDVHCNSCGCSFCGGCGLASHLPLPCTLAKGYEQWMDLIHKMTLSALELVCEIDITNSKPKSTEATELLQGFRRESLALIRAARGGGDEDAAGGAEGNGAAAAGGSAEAHAEVDGADGVLVDDASLPPRRDAAALRPMMTRRGRPEQGAAASSATSAAVGGGALADRSKPQEKEEEKAALKDYDVKKETKSCPACGIRVEKNSGCQHITCKHCGWEWCWSCLQAWKGHKNCDPLANLASYDFSKEFAWVKSRLSVVNGLRGGTAPSSDLSLEEFTAKRREQMQDVNDNYEGNVEKENQQEAYRHLRRQQPDPLSQLISLHDQVANGLLSRMNQFSRHMTSQRPDYEVIGMLLHRCARLMYHFPAIGSAAGRAFERLALALIGIDEKRGGPSRERIMNRPVDQRMNQLHEIMTQALGPEAIDGLTGLEMLLRDVEQRTIQVEHLAVDITLNEGYSSASRRHHHHQQQQRGLSGPLQVGMQTSTNDRYHFESLLRTAFAWRALGSYMDQNWQILVNQAARMMDAAMAAGPELAFWGPAPFAAPVAMAMMLRQRDRERVHMMMLLGHRHARRHQQHQQRIAAYHQQAAPPPPPQQQQQQEGGGIGGGGVGGFGARLRRLVPPPFFFHPAAPATNGGQAAPVAAAGGGGDGGGGEGVGDGGGGGGVVHNVAAVGAGAAAAVGAEGAGNRGDRIGAAGLLGDARQRLREVRQRLEDRRRMTMIMAQEEDEAMAIRMMMGGEPERNWLVDWAEEEEEEEAVAPRMFAPIHHPRAWHHQHQQNDAANANNNNRQNHHNNARRHLHALAFALSDAEGAIDEGTRKEFRELFQMEDVPRTSAIRIKAAVREGIKRRELAVKKIIEKLNHAGIGVSDLTQPEKESVLLKHYHEWTKASTKDQGSMMIDEEDEDHEDLEEMWEKNFRALEMMTRLGLIELPSTENLAGRLAFIDVARAADKLVTRRMLQYEGTESGSSALLAAPTANISSNSSTSSNKRRRVMGDYVSPISEEKNSYGLTPRLRESMVLLMEGITVSKEVQDEEKRETGRGKGSVSTHYSSSR